MLERIMAYVDRALEFFELGLADTYFLFPQPHLMQLFGLPGRVIFLPNLRLCCRSLRLLVRRQLRAPSEFVKS
jgi:hypothetical protein